MKAGQVTRWIRGYDKRDERLAVEFALPDADLALLRSLWGGCEEDPFLWACYPVEPSVAARLSGSMPIAWDFEHLDYFLEADSEPLA